MINQTTNNKSTLHIFYGCEWKEALLNTDFSQNFGVALQKVYDLRNSLYS